MLDRIADYNWEHAFQYANGFTRDDVLEILFIHDGENDESNWILVARLTNGKFAWLSAGCDYTGWD